MIQIVRLTSNNKSAIGGKADSLNWLIKKGFLVPETFVLTYDGYAAFLSDRLQFEHDLRREIKEKLDLNVSYAVRSSANIEDNCNHSFAGQFKSVLSVCGLDELLKAVINVYESVHSSQLLPYLDKMMVSSGEIKIAVIMQHMIQPMLSGVVFSKNPVTGLDEMIVELVKGSGELLLQEGFTPERWVYKWGEWKEKPVNPQADEAFVLKVIRAAESIKAAYRSAVDMEWVYDGQNLYWLQMRPITMLEDLNVYSNRISKDMLPGLIKPLIWSINIPLINTVWVGLFTELIGPNHISPQDLSKAFHYHTYFNMKTIGKILAAVGLPEETLELMMGLEGGSQKPSFRPGVRSLVHIPRMIRFMLHKFLYVLKLEPLIKHIRAEYNQFEKRAIAVNDEKAILELVDEIFTFTQQKVAYANIVIPLLMFAYNGILKNRLAKRGIDYMLLDLTEGLNELADYDPGYHLAELNQHLLALNPDLVAQIQAGDYTSFRQISGIESFQKAVEDFIDHFGHLSESGNDFSSKPWRESPELVLVMIAAYVRRSDTEQQPKI